MFYHVLIEDNENQIIEHNFDLTEKEIKVLANEYKLGNTFHFNGLVLNSNKLRRIQFFKSEKKLVKISEEIAKNGNAEYSTEDLLRFSLNLKEYLQDVTSFILSNIDIKTKEIKKNDSNKVFIVHGHDNELKNEVYSFIKDLNLTPVILHLQASEGSTIIEKIENHVNESGYGITLYSPCDIGGKDKDSLKKRARQNVVFEHGFLIGRLGRNKTCAIVKEMIEKPNDISGLVYITYDINEGWKLQLFRELKKVFKNIEIKV